MWAWLIEIRQRERDEAKKAADGAIAYLADLEKKRKAAKPKVAQSAVSSLDAAGDAAVFAAAVPALTARLDPVAALQALCGELVGDAPKVELAAADAAAAAVAALCGDLLGDAAGTLALDAVERDCIAEALAKTHGARSSHAIVATEQLGLDGTQSLAEVQRALLDRNDPVNAAALPFYSTGGLDPDVVAGVVAAHATIDKIPNVDRKAARWRAAECAANDLALAATATLRLPDGPKALALHPVFGPDAAGVAGRLEGLVRSLAHRVHKEASRVSVRRARKRMLLRPRPTPEAAHIFRREGRRVVAELRSAGFSTIDGALGAGDARALRDRFDDELGRSAWGPPKQDPCNPGASTRNLLVAVGDRRRAPPEETRARRAARVAVSLLAGVAYELEAATPLRLAIPPDAMVASYPPGTAYREHVDWFPDEAANDREVTLLLYANPDYEAGDGGDLSLARPDGSRTEIAPLPGRLVVFLSRLVTHEIRANAGDSRRVAIQLWLDRAEAGFAFEEDAAFLENAGDPFDFAPLN